MIKKIVQSSILLFVIPISLISCATYAGPGLTTVMSTSCANEFQFERFRACINSTWYSGVVAAGYGSDSGVLLFNGRMQLLSQAVAQRQLSDLDAIANATNFAVQLRAVEQAEMARQNEVLMRALSQAANPQTANPSRPLERAQSVVACTKIGDASRQIYNFYGVACPVGYAPAL